MDVRMVAHKRFPCQPHVNDTYKVRAIDEVELPSAALKRRPSLAPTCVLSPACEHVIRLIQGRIKWGEPHIDWIPLNLAGLAAGHRPGSGESPTDRH